MVAGLVLADLDGTCIRSFMREGEPCGTCRGSGLLVGRNPMRTVVQPCPRCKGSGRQRARAENYDLVEALPGRVEQLAALREAGTQVAFVTNQGGVAFGYQTDTQVVAKLGEVCRVLLGDAVLGGFNVCWAPGPPMVSRPPHVYVSLGHPNATVELYKTAPDDSWRKPGPGMLLQAMRDYDVGPEATVFVGDMESDWLAAEAANVRYVDAEEFFGG